MRTSGDFIRLTALQSWTKLRAMQNSRSSVLIVEDSEDDTLLMVRELQRGGFDPVFERVQTPDSMTAALQAQAWDLIISD